MATIPITTNISMSNKTRPQMVMLFEVKIKTAEIRV